MPTDALTHTFQTRLQVDEEGDRLLQQSAALLSRVERTLFAQIAAGKDPALLKSPFIKQFGITARQFNACRSQVEGKIRSLKELNKQRIRSLKEAIKRAEGGKRRLSSTQAFWRSRRLDRMKGKLTRLEANQGKVTLCYGSRKLFRQQFHDSPFPDHKAWKAAWQAKRESSFFTLGSKDETAGNQTCSAFLQSDGTLTLRLRLPTAHPNKYLLLPGVTFAYGQKSLEQALTLSLAISYRFQRDEKGWRVFASTAAAQPNWISREGSGAIGLDINRDHLALTETDRSGNAIGSHTIPLVTYGKSQNQRKALIGEACAQAVALAVKSQKPLIVENLNFQKKKETLRQQSAPLARMLSAFAYRMTLQHLVSRAYRHGIKVHQVNPAYTSLVGGIKFAKAYGLSTHHAAALCIARRHQKFSEALPRQAQVANGKGAYFAFSLPVRNRRNHEWAFFREVFRAFKAALAEHFRVAHSQSSDPPMDLWDTPSRGLLVGFQHANRQQHCSAGVSGQ